MDHVFDRIPRYHDYAFIAAYCSDGVWRVTIAHKQAGRIIQTGLTADTDQIAISICTKLNRHLGLTARQISTILFAAEPTANTVPA